MVAMISTGERRGAPTRSATADSASIQAGRETETAGIRCMLAPMEKVDTGQTTLNERIDTCQSADGRTGLGAFGGEGPQHEMPVLVARAHRVRFGGLGRAPGDRCGP